MIEVEGLGPLKVPPAELQVTGIRNAICHSGIKGDRLANEHSIRHVVISALCARAREYNFQRS